MIKLEKPHILFEKSKIYRNSPTSTGNTVNGKKTVLVLVEGGAEAIAAADKEQLLKILAACKLKEDHVLIQGTYDAALRKASAVNNVIIFGEVPFSANMQLPKMKMVKIDGLAVIKAEALSKISKSDAGKKALWMELKKMFGL
ncbi:MAG: hypothetical protein U0V74_05490 [Chitinophagales bacterium]